MHPPLRRFLSLFGFALAALWLAAPAAAWYAHYAAHIGSPVAVDSHHHHEDGGGISAHEGETPSDAVQDGHDHMPSLSAAISATLPQAPVIPAPLFGRLLPSQGPLNRPAGLNEPPPPRPPRTA